MCAACKTDSVVSPVTGCSIHKMNILKQSRKLDEEELEDNSDSDMELEDMYFDGQKTPKKPKTSIEGPRMKKNEDGRQKASQNNGNPRPYEPVEPNNIHDEQQLEKDRIEKERLIILHQQIHQRTHR